MPAMIEIRYYPELIGAYDPAEEKRLEDAGIAAAKCFGIEAASASVGLLNGSNCKPHYLILVRHPDGENDGQAEP